MKKLLLGSVFYFMAAAGAVAGPGYYEIRVSDCSPAAMQRAVDNLSARNRAVIAVVKCDATPRAPVRVARPAPVMRPVTYYDYCCDCDMGYYL